MPDQYLVVQRELELFLMCFPIKYIKNIVIAQSNKHLQVPVTKQEFFVFIGCLLFIACHPRVDDQDVWWLSRAISPNKGSPFCLNNYISKNCFKEIMGAIWYTNRRQPKYLNCFHDIRQMQDEWNKHMAGEYFSLW